MYRAFCSIWYHEGEWYAVTDFIYEKDLTNMKFNILTSPFHRRMVAELSGKYGVTSPKLMKVMMEKLDMSMLENLPARYGAWKSDTCDSGLEFGIGAALMSRYIPLVDETDAASVYEKAKKEMESGTSREEAISEGKKEISGMIFK